MDAEREPVFCVVRGVPTVEELAALVGAFAAGRRQPAGRNAPVTTFWAQAARPGTLSPGGIPTRPASGAWRRSGLPH
nr:acyl-CoA carboxylase epsilon subunit [Micromonospora sp. DSM 115978]